MNRNTIKYQSIEATCDRRVTIERSNTIHSSDSSSTAGSVNSFETRLKGANKVDNTKTSSLQQGDFKVTAENKVSSSKIKDIVQDSVADTNCDELTKMLRRSSLKTDSEKNSNTAPEEKVFEKLDSFIQESEDVTGKEGSANVDASTHPQVSFSRIEGEVMVDNEKTVQETQDSSAPTGIRKEDDDDDDKSITVEDLTCMESTASSSQLQISNTRAFSGSRRRKKRRSQQASSQDYGLSVECPLACCEDSRSSAISFECHNSVLFELLSQELGDVTNPDEINPRLNPSFYNEDVDVPNVLSKMDMSIIAREVDSGKLSRNGMHCSFSSNIFNDNGRQQNEK